MTDARWVGVLDEAPARELAGVLGVEPPSGVLPPMWHTVFLLPVPTRAGLGHDGHALRGIPEPPTEPHRRMFAGGRATHHAALRLGEPVEKTSSVVSSVLKEGRSGALTFVTVRHEYRQDGAVAVTDDHDIVYRPLPPGDPEPVEVLPVAEAEVLESERAFDVDPVTLFLFSKVTQNAHRIHYDLPFARSEGHPDVVVHGPLQVVLMAAALGDITGREFSYRLIAPAYGAQSLRVGRPVGGGAAVVVVDGLGRRVAKGDVA